MADGTLVYLAHGASGNAESMLPYVRGLAERGIAARTVGLPVGRAERAVQVYREQVGELQSAVIGGHSYGGRVASMLAAETSPKGLVLLSYPLHRPGHPEWEQRVLHWGAIRCKVLLLSGDQDPFARIDLLQAAIARLSDAELITYPKVGHGLKSVLDDAVGRVAEFVRRL